MAKGDAEREVRAYVTVTTCRECPWFHTREVKHWLTGGATLYEFTCKCKKRNRTITPDDRCTRCYSEHRQKRCPNCARRAREYVIAMPSMRRVVKNGNLTPAQAAEFLLMVREWLATHWTDRENPRHEIMEAVCHSRAA